MNDRTKALRNRVRVSQQKFCQVKLLTRVFAATALLLFSSFNFAEQQQQSQSLQAFIDAQQLLKQSNQLEEQAKRSLLTANQTRQLVSKKRVEVRKEKDKQKREVFELQATELAKSLETQQKDGASQRTQALLLKRKAMDLFSQGLTNEWSTWVNNTQPLTMDKETLDYISHNAVVRSVHPTMLNKMGLNKTGLNSSKNETTNQNATSKNSDNNKEKMSLRIASLIGQSAPADLDISAFQLSNDQNYLAHIEVHNAVDTEQSNVSQVPLNQMHQWRLLISDLHGKPVTGKEIEVLGHMPGHVHGLPTQPQVTKELASGVYLVEGVKFQMQGWWVMQFELESPTQESASSAEEKNKKSSFTFNLIL
jgi:YtkA-like protein